MKLLEFKKEDNKKEIPIVGERQLNKKKVAITGVIGVVIIILIIIAGLYVTNVSVRDFMDLYILRKSVTESSLNYIELDPENIPYMHAFNNSVVTLEKNTLTKYNSSGKKDVELKVEVNEPLFESSGSYLIIAEKNKQKAYLIHNASIAWEKSIEGNISKVSVNKNGFTTIIITGTTYKSVIAVYDKNGKELFKTYLSSTIAIDACVSDDNKYMSFAEINTSGTLIKSTIKTVSIEKAKSTPAESIINTYNAEDNNLIMNIKYQEKNRLACMYNNSIHVIQGDKDEELIALNKKDKKITFADIELNNYAYAITEKSAGLFKANSTLELYNTASKRDNIYNYNGVAKKIYSNDGVVAVDLGTEIHFVGTNGWLLKKYVSNQEVKKIIVTDGLAGIVYRDKLEFLNL